MADQSNGKRQHKNGIAPLAKREKRNMQPVNDVKEEEETEASITNICSELLDRIFDSLDLESLVNVAATCKRLQIAIFDRRLATNGGNRVFWSGGEEAMNLATSFAQSNGKETLGMTRAGQNLQNSIASKNIPWSEARPMWARLSSAYAKRASGSVDFFGAENAGSIWVQYEKPILIQNAVKIIFHYMALD